jgi:nucleoside 2-deoxyribosyltransferase
VYPLSKCPLCDRDVHGAVHEVDGHLIDEVTCGTCGTFRISGKAKSLLEDDSWKARRWILSGVTRRASDNESPVELLSDNLEPFLAYAQIPRSPLEAINGMMRLIDDRVTSIDGYAQLDFDRDYPLLFLTRREQMVDIYLHLKKLDRIRDTSHMTGKAPVVQLTLPGWQRLEELRKTSSNSDQAFVAMSFDDDMRTLYADAIAPALKATGYEPFRVDDRPHNEKIDDRIVAEIRQSGLVVADFTQQKNGVYWEAGFAQGLGIPVIRTCRSDDLRGNKLHFDTRQYLHIEWTAAADLRQKLETHIRATIPGRATAKRRGPA